MSSANASFDYIKLKLKNVVNTFKCTCTQKREKYYAVAGFSPTSKSKCKWIFLFLPVGHLMSKATNKHDGVSGHARWQGGN